jgi:hypothetical protein
LRSAGQVYCAGMETEKSMEVSHPWLDCRSSRRGARRQMVGRGYMPQVTVVRLQRSDRQTKSIPPQSLRHAHLPSRDKKTEEPSHSWPILPSKTNSPKHARGLDAGMKSRTMGLHLSSASALSALCKTVSLRRRCIRGHLTTFPFV